MILIMILILWKVGNHMEDHEQDQDQEQDGELSLATARFRIRRESWQA